MPKSTSDFGEWRTAPDGTAHYVLNGACLCGARVKKWGGLPERKPGPIPGAVGAFITPLCMECLDLNVARWQGLGGNQELAPVRPQRTFWWRQPRRRGFEPRPKT